MIDEKFNLWKKYSENFAEAWLSSILTATSNNTPLKESIIINSAITYIGALINEEERPTFMQTQAALDYLALKYPEHKNLVECISKWFKNLDIPPMISGDFGDFLTKTPSITFNLNTFKN